MSRPPLFCIEVTSPAMVGHDQVAKLAGYALAGGPRYVIIEAVVGRQLGTPRLCGYELVSGDCRPLPLDEADRLDDR